MVTGQAETCQIVAASVRMARSEERKPLRAVLSRLRRSQPLGSDQTASTAAWASR